MQEELRAVCEGLAARLQRAVAIDDPGMHLLVHTAHHEEHDQVDQTRITSVLTMQIPADVLEYVTEGRHRRGRRPGAGAGLARARRAEPGRRPGPLRRTAVRLSVADRRRPHPQRRGAADGRGRRRGRGPDHAPRAAARRPAPQPRAGPAARPGIRGRQRALTRGGRAHRDRPPAGLLARGRAGGPGRGRGTGSQRRRGDRAGPRPPAAGTPADADGSHRRDQVRRSWPAARGHAPPADAGNPARPRQPAVRRPGPDRADRAGRPGRHRAGGRRARSGTQLVRAGRREPASRRGRVWLRPGRVATTSSASTGCWYTCRWTACRPTRCRSACGS